MDGKQMTRRGLLAAAAGLGVGLRATAAPAPGCGGGAASARWNGFTRPDAAR